MPNDCRTACNQLGLLPAAETLEPQSAPVSSNTPGAALEPSPLDQSAPCLPTLNLPTLELALEKCLALREQVMQSTARARVQKPCCVGQPELQQSQTPVLFCSTQKAYPKFRRLKQICKVAFWGVTFYLAFIGQPEQIFQAFYQGVKFGFSTDCANWKKCNAK